MAKTYSGTHSSDRNLRKILESIKLDWKILEAGEASWGIIGSQFLSWVVPCSTSGCGLSTVARHQIDCQAARKIAAAGHTDWFVGCVQDPGFVEGATNWGICTVATFSMVGEHGIIISMPKCSANPSMWFFVSSIQLGSSVGWAKRMCGLISS